MIGNQYLVIQPNLDWACSLLCLIYFSSFNTTFYTGKNSECCCGLIVIWKAVVCRDALLFLRILVILPCLPLAWNVVWFCSCCITWLICISICWLSSLCQKISCRVKCTWVKMFYIYRFSMVLMMSSNYFPEQH